MSNRSLLPPNSTPLERDLEQTMARIETVPVEDLKKVWNPATCPAPLLPWLAWALSVDEWESDWTEEQKREVCRQSYSVHARKGTVGAIRTALFAIGVPVELIEWFQDGGAPGTFSLQTFVGLEGLTKRQQDAIYRVALATKNERSHLRQYLVRTAAKGAVLYGATVATGEQVTVFPAEGETGIPPFSLPSGEMELGGYGNNSLAQFPMKSAGPWWYTGSWVSHSIYSGVHLIQGLGGTGLFAAFNTSILGKIRVSFQIAHFAADIATPSAGVVLKFLDDRNHLRAEVRPTIGNIRVLQIIDGRRTYLGSLNGVSFDKGDWVTTEWSDGVLLMQAASDPSKTLSVATSSVLESGEAVGLFQDRGAGGTFTLFVFSRLKVEAL